MMKSIFLGLFLAWAVAQAAAAPETYGIDPIHSFMLFKVRFLWASKIDGCFCGGISGTVSFDPAAPEKSTVQNRHVGHRICAAEQRYQKPGFSERSKFPAYHIQEQVGPESQ